MYSCFYDTIRFRYIHKHIEQSKLFKYEGPARIKKTASFIGSEKNIYIDTSDGVNEDLELFEYCGRVKRIAADCKGKPFILFKSAYSKKWSQKICDFAHEKNGQVIPFFKWSFNDQFYSKVYNKRKDIIEAYNATDKEYDIGYFCGLKPYDYPKPSTIDPDIAWADHKNFNLPGESENTGDFWNYSRRNIYEKIQNSKFKVLHKQMSYSDYIAASFKCKVIINPPGVGEYTSRMFDQSYLGNCVVLRKNTYDNGYSWKKHLPEVNFNSDDWADKLSLIVDNHRYHALECKSYFDNFWSSDAVFKYLITHINL